MPSLTLAKSEVASLLQANLSALASVPEQGIDARIMLQMMAGVLTETAFFFEQPDESLDASLNKIAVMLGTGPWDGELPGWVNFEPQAIDRHTERGRELARLAIEDWADCEFAFHDMLVWLTHHLLVSFEADGVPRDESFRLLIEYATRCMAFEVAAQELCDILIEKKIGRDGWTLGDCLGGLSGAAGWRLAKFNLLQKKKPKDQVPARPADLDSIVHVMTQEAVRMGVPAGSDWRFGLAANDCPINPPTDLLNGVEPYCQLFFSAIPMTDLKEQAVACAKAAGRMLAVAATGDNPEIAPVIAKPLAMAAITETYRSFWTQF